MQDNETPWWRPVDDSCLLTVDHVAVGPFALVYFIEVHDRSGQKHRFRAEGVAA